MSSYFSDIRQTSQYARHMASSGWKVEKISGSFCYLKKFPIVGYFVKIQRPQNFDEKTIEKLRSKYRIFQIVVEPSGKKQEKILRKLKFGQTTPYIPSKTLYIDLTQSKQNLLSSFQKDARYALRKTQNLKISEMKNVSEFFEIWRSSVPVSRYVMPLSQLTSLKNSFKNDCLFLLNSEKNSGAIFLIGENTCYYWQAFTSPDARKTLVQYKIVWFGTLWAKKRGAKIFDMEGIYDKRFPQKSWHGFTHFKKSFGGKNIEYPGAFVKTVIPLKK